jgi:hypothetical protein
LQTSKAKELGQPELALAINQPPHIRATTAPTLRCPPPPSFAGAILDQIQLEVGQKKLEMRKAKEAAAKK